jgi:hypothetical protein
MDCLACYDSEEHTFSEVQLHHPYVFCLCCLLSHAGTLGSSSSSSSNTSAAISTAAAAAAVDPSAAAAVALSVLLRRQQLSQQFVTSVVQAVLKAGGSGPRGHPGPLFQAVLVS